jgi:subtilisin family serine protease
MHPWKIVSIGGILVSGVFAASARPGPRPALAQPSDAGWQAKVDPWVLARASEGRADFLVFLSDQADLAGAEKLATKAEKGAWVFRRLSDAARSSQPPVLAALDALGAKHRSFWVANMIQVEGGLATVAAMANRSDVARVSANPRVAFSEPLPADAARVASLTTIEWNVQQIRAPQVWAAGFTGQGIVVGGADTGYQWNHPALINKYRGWNGVSADHNYNWHDAIHSDGGFCGPDSPAPCDDNVHGSHTMGTMVGDDGAGNQIGVAPGAKWIGCRNMDQGNGTPATYSECFQWFIAPTNSSGLNPDPSKSPHVINNSWACPPSEGCTDPNVLETVVENTRAAGIVVVVSAGNGGPGCSSVSDPPAIYAASFSVGATDMTDTIASFSSRGPVTVDGSGRPKPDLSGPGVLVRSCNRNSGYSVFSGTSMAGPHVAGTVGLVLSAAPNLIGQVSAIENLLKTTSVPRTTSQSCGGVAGSQIPNNTYGWGRVDALSAVQAVTSAASLYTVTPCRLLDTRDPIGTWGGPALSAGSDRTFPIAGRCGIPAGAKAVSVNVTVTGPTSPGFLTLYPGATALPSVSTINYSPGQTRANNAVIRLGTAGDLTARCGQGSGTANLVLDVNGYFQ